MAANRCILILAVLTVLLAVCCCGLGGLLVWLLYFADTSRPTNGAAVNETQTVNVSITTNSTGRNLTQAMMERFPGYFRTVEEQRIYERFELSNSSIVPVTNTSFVHKRCVVDNKCEKGNGTTSNAYKPWVQGSLNRTRRQIKRTDQCALDSISERDLSYHGCCVSYSDFIAPDRLKTPGPNPRQVTVVQLERARQYFSIQICCQARDCPACQCSYVYTTVMAVLKRSGGRYGIGRVKVPSCCKCLNTSDD